jgi:hypothetical protein
MNTKLTFFEAKTLLEFIHTEFNKVKHPLGLQMARVSKALTPMVTNHQQTITNILMDAALKDAQGNIVDVDGNIRPDDDNNFEKYILEEKKPAVKQAIKDAISKIEIEIEIPKVELSSLVLNKEGKQVKMEELASEIYTTDQLSILLHYFFV